MQMQRPEINKQCTVALAPSWSHGRRTTEGTTVLLLSSQSLRSRMEVQITHEPMVQERVGLPLGVTQLACCQFWVMASRGCSLGDRDYGTYLQGNQERILHTYILFAHLSSPGPGL